MTHRHRPFRIGDRVLIGDTIAATLTAGIPGRPGYWYIVLDDGDERVASETTMTHTLRVVSRTVTKKARDLQPGDRIVFADDESIWEVLDVDGGVWEISGQVLTRHHDAWLMWSADDDVNVREAV